jgi:hypothetical protein
LKTILGEVIKLNKNIELLNYIYQNAEMGKDTISQLIRIIDDFQQKQALELQLKEYTEIYNLANNKIKEANKDSKGIGTLSKITTYIMININTLKSKTPSHIAEMMMQGSTMGIIDITRKIKEYESADKDILQLADRLLKFEERSFEEMKKFL